MVDNSSLTVQQQTCSVMKEAKACALTTMMMVVSLSRSMTKAIMNPMACAYYNFGELCLCSAMSYVDRFLSVYELPVDSPERGDKRWAIQLVAVACLSLAAKIEEVNVPSTVDLQAGETKFLFDGKTIQRMEILVLNHLHWKIKAYTPCNFIDYYLRKTNDNEFPSGL
ncbi:Cyclin-D4-1 [Sesamum angolense]|uniref:Cyclin-D4-1 n=1 Tax=Sesamum angolense TaxID=2727404 RepID=A0AAE2BQF9_9LAMI|nr:Cyclin-D4-1 [Sesamum angolense]